MAALPAASGADAVVQAPGPMTSTQAPVVLDLGKRRRKQIRQLRRGQGKLLDDINGAVEELRIAGTLRADAQPVIVVVQQKRRRARAGFLPGL